MMRKTLSMRGQPVDFNRLQQANSNKAALGNANMNAKGDIVDPNGIVLKTQEQIEAEWAAQRDRMEQSIAVDIKANLPPHIQKVLDLRDQQFEPMVQAAPVQEKAPEVVAKVETPIAKAEPPKTAEAAPAEKTKKITESDQ